MQFCTGYQSNPLLGPWMAQASAPLQLHLELFKAIVSVNA